MPADCMLRKYGVKLYALMLVFSVGAHFAVPSVTQRSSNFCLQHLGEPRLIAHHPI